MSAHEYYYAAGDEQRGPVPAEQLPGLGVGVGTLVWREGMAGDWVRADQVPEVAAILAQAAAAEQDGAYDVAPGPAPAYAPPQGYAPAPAAYLAYPPQGYAPAYAPPAYAPGYPPATQGPLGYAGANPGYGGGYGSPYGGNAYGGGQAYSGSPPGHGQCVASMVLGISALAMVCAYGLGLVLGILAVVFGHQGNAAHRRGTGRTNGMATAGTICGYIAIGLNVLGLIVVAIVMAGAG